MACIFFKCGFRFIILKENRLRFTYLLFCFILLIIFPVCEIPPDVLKIASTTSIENSGLTDVLLPAFQKATGTKCHLIAVGTGKALEIGRNGDVDLSIMLGGNIRFYTRNITTSIALETSKGEFSRGVALGLILLFFAFTVNIVFQTLVKRRDTRVVNVPV